MTESSELATKLREMSDNPRTVLLNAARDNKLVGVGECHVGEPNVRPLIADLMPQFKAEGVTDLFIEMAAKAKPALDELNRTGHITDRSSLNWLAREDSYVHVLEAAHAAGIAVHAVDTADSADKRDATMAKAIEDTLHANPGAKGIFFVGGSHLKRGDYTYNAGTFSAAANILRSDGISLYSIVEGRQICNAELSDMPQIDRPLALRIDRNELMKNQSFGGGRTQDWDALIVFPRSKENLVDLGHTLSTDADLKLFFDDYLTGISRQLTTDFSLKDTQISDDGLKLLPNLSNLKRVDLRHTKVTAAGVAWLHERMPQVTIDTDLNNRSGG